MQRLWEFQRICIQLKVKNNMEYQKGKIPYTASFVLDPGKLLAAFPPKHKHIFGHHLTLKFNVKSFESVEVGKKSLLKIIARVFDENGDALLVETDRSEKKYPHITLSCAEGVRRSYSDEMITNAVLSHNIEYFKEPFEIDVIEGYFNGYEDVIS